MRACITADVYVYALHVAVLNIGTVLVSGPPTVAPLDHPMSRAIIRGRLYFALYLDPILRCSPLTPSPGLTHCSNRTNNFFLLSFFPLLFFERTVSLRYPLISNSSRSLFREIRRLDGRLCVTSSCCEEQFWGREVMIIRGREEGVSYRIGRLINVALRSFIRYHIRHFLSFEG